MEKIFVVLILGGGMRCIPHLVAETAEAYYNKAEVPEGTDEPIVGKFLLMAEQGTAFGISEGMSTGDAELIYGAKVLKSEYTEN